METEKEKDDGLLEMMELKKCEATRDGLEWVRERKWGKLWVGLVARRFQFSAARKSDAQNPKAQGWVWNLERVEKGKFGFPVRCG